MPHPEADVPPMGLAGRQRGAELWESVVAMDPTVKGTVA